MKIISVNSGSSSIKFQLFDMPEEHVVSSGQVEKIGFSDAIVTIKFNGEKHQKITPIKDHATGVKEIIDGLIKFGVLADMSEIKGVGHRIVQGGEYFKESALVTKEVLDKIIAYADMAPLHNIPNAITIKGFQAILPNVPHVAVFDTTFHQTMKEDAYLYATPYEWYTEYGVRRYGAHGTSHKYISQEVNKLLGRNDTKVIVCHIGNGASISAVKDGQCVDTSMGFTPLEGIPMGTRTGNLDPAILNFMEHKLNVDSDEMYQILNKKGGYLGVSGVSSDARDLEAAMNEGNHRAKLAYEIQTKRIADYIGSYYVYMGGLDAIAFTAGIGENSPTLRRFVLERLEVLGVKMDENLNNTRGSQVISSEDSKVKVFVLSTDEEVMIARDTMAFVK